MKSNPLPAFDGAYLERYRRGELSPAEAHALEKAALEDTLLADALDGFRLASLDTTADLSMLRSRLNDRIETNQAVVRQLPKTRFFSPFMRVAAMLLLLIGAGWFSYVYWIDPRESTLASNAPAPSAVSEQRTFTESSPTQPHTPVALPPAPIQPSESVQYRPDRTIRPIEVQLETREMSSNKPEEDLVVKAEEPPALSETKQIEVVSADNTVKDLDKVNAEVAQKELDLATSRQATAMTLTAKEKSLKRSKMDIQRADKPEPVAGWAAYEDYLYGNGSRKSVAPTASNTVTRWEVLLSFEVDDKGRPTEIRVEESGGTYYDGAAKKLLVEGPDWKPGKPGSRGQLRVHF